MPGPLRSISSTRRAKAAPAFAGHSILRTGLDAVFDCGIGWVWAPHMPAPGAFLAQAVCYYLGGDASSPAAGSILSAIPSGALTLPPDAPWRSAVRRAWGLRCGRTRLFSFTRHTRLGTPPPDLPDGYRLVPVDNRTVRGVIKNFGRGFLGPHRSVRQFLTVGGGWAIVHEGEVVSAAAIVLPTRQSAEVSVATAPAYRGRGFATAVCRALLGTIRARGLAPEWTANSSVSARLARSLGFTDPQPVWAFWKLF